MGRIVLITLSVDGSEETVCGALKSAAEILSNLGERRAIAATPAAAAAAGDGVGPKPAAAASRDPKEPRRPSGAADKKGRKGAVRLSIENALARGPASTADLAAKIPAERRKVIKMLSQLRYLGVARRLPQGLWCLA